MNGVPYTDTEGLIALQRGPAGEILRLLQRYGPLSAKQLQDQLGVRSLNAVREQLTSLTAAGLITATAVRRGAGRPTHMYSLSARAQALFPNGYDLLLKLLLDELLLQEGAERLQALLNAVSLRLADHYGTSPEGDNVRQRLAALEQTYAARGTPIAVVEHDDVIEVHKYSCPYFDVAQENASVCIVEQRMLEHLLGRNVQLARRMIEGHAGCCFVTRNDHEVATKQGSLDSANYVEIIETVPDHIKRHGTFPDSE